MNRYESLMARMQKGEKILIDGATGTEVSRRGIPAVEHAWNAGGAKTHPDIMLQIHQDYIERGAEIIISNTFATGRAVLQDAGWEAEFDLLNRRGVELAIEARKALAADDVLVAGGISHWWWKTDPSLEILRQNTREQAIIMQEAGAELIMLEMMSDIKKIEIQIEESQATGLPVWVGFSCKVDDEGVPRLSYGETLEAGIKALAGYNIPLISIMHTKTPQIDACLDVVEAHWDRLVGVYAHSGEYVDGQAWVYDGIIHPDDYADAAERWLNRGVSLIGTCCGLGVEHIEVLHKRLFA